MSAPVSVVIPTLRASRAIGPCLAALAQGVLAGVIREVVIVDAEVEGTADPEMAEIAEAVGARLVLAPPGRGRQMAEGAGLAEAPWLLFLHADTVLSPGWGEAVADHLARHPDRAGHFRLAFDDTAPMARITAGWANLRSRLFALPYGDQGLLISAALYGQVGGHPDQPLMEDVALVRRLGRRRLARMGATATTSAERYRRDGWIARGWRNLTTLALYGLGVAPERLAERYRRR